MLEAGLSPAVRLALAYAPSRVRPLHLALFALDARLATIAASPREPMLAQIKLAWWRDRLNQPAEQWPRGEPLLELLAKWNEERRELNALTDAWEALLIAEPIGQPDIAGLGEARGAAFAALARQCGAGEWAEAARQVGRSWSLADLSAGTAEAAPLAGSAAPAASQISPVHRFPKSLRPYMVINELTNRAIERQPPAFFGSPLDLLAAIRIGLLGR